MVRKSLVQDIVSPKEEKIAKKVFEFENILQKNIVDQVKTKEIKKF